jgi:hypothetical protein
VLFRKAKSSADQWGEARRLLAEIEELFEAGNEKEYAAKIRQVLAGDDAVVGAWLTSGGFWGGMGSMIDCAFCTPSALGREVDKQNAREFMRLIVRLGTHQLSSGIYTGGLTSPGIKPHIKKWIKVLSTWLSEGLA